MLGWTVKKGRINSSITLCRIYVIYHNYLTHTKSHIHKHFCLHTHTYTLYTHTLSHTYSHNMHTHIHSYREALAAEKAKEDYMKRHMAGETEQARLDLARLAIVSPPISYSIITLVWLNILVYCIYCIYMILSCDLNMNNVILMYHYMSWTHIAWLYMTDWLSRCVRGARKRLLSVRRRVEHPGGLPAGWSPAGEWMRVGAGI